MGFVANFIHFPAVQKFWKSVKIWQSYREFKGGNFFETQCRFHSTEFLLSILQYCFCYMYKQKLRLPNYMVLRKWYYGASSPWIQVLPVYITWHTHTVTLIRSIIRCCTSWIVVCTDPSTGYKLLTVCLYMYIEAVLCGRPHYVCQVLYYRDDVIH